MGNGNVGMKNKKNFREWEAKKIWEMGTGNGIRESRSRRTLIGAL